MNRDEGVGRLSRASTHLKAKPVRVRGSPKDTGSLWDNGLLMKNCEVS